MDRESSGETSHRKLPAHTRTDLHTFGLNLRGGCVLEKLVDIFEVALRTSLPESRDHGCWHGGAEKPWEMVGDGTEAKRPDSLKPLPPPAPQEQKK